MSPRDLRKKSITLRTRALGEPNPEMQANFRALANVYDALARMIDETQRKRSGLRLLSREPV